MAGIGIVFPGQGAQFSGMGLSLYENSPAAKEVFERADALRPGTSEQCFRGSAEELKETINTQPCLWAVEMAAASALAEAGITATATAGFSVGELTAFTYAKATDFDTGFKAVCKRASLMDAASKKVDSVMAAVMKLPAKTVENICDNFKNVWPVNYNCPGQITVSGLREDMEQLAPAVKAAGGMAMMLNVSGAFHSPLMEEAAAEFSKFMDESLFSAPEISLYSNYTGEEYGSDMKSLLVNQIYHPVRWQSIIERMAANGIDTFIEAGPGKVLSGLIKRTLSGVRIISVSDWESLEKAKEVLK